MVLVRSRFYDSHGSFLKFDAISIITALPHISMQYDIYR